MNDSPTPIAPKKRRVRKLRKEASPTDALSALPIVAQASYNECILPIETRKRTRRPRKKKTNVEASLEMISPNDPIVTAQTESLPLAVPVGLPFSAVPPKPVAPTSQVALGVAMLVPIERNRITPATTSQWPLSDFLSTGGQTISRFADVLRRHPRVAGLAVTAILLGISLTTAIILSDFPEADAPSGSTAEVIPVLAAAPVIPAMQETPVSIAEESDPLAGIRIVDPSWDKKSSCNEGTWPYIEQRCLMKDETKGETTPETKIGPRMIDSRTRPNAPETAGPIGSTTAIVPAVPRVSTTDGVATRDMDTTRDMDIEKHNEDMLPDSVADIAPGKLAEIRASAIRAQAIAARYTSAQKHRPVRTFRVTDESKSAQRRAASVKRKRQPTVADAGRKARARVVNQAQAPQPSQFFFPFGWFVQAR